MNIKRLFTIWIAATLLMSTIGTTANAKPQFDNPEWEAFFNNPSDKLPEGLPLGKGCISNYNPTQAAQAYQPYHMTKNKNIVLSKSAIQREFVYATQTQKDFLKAMSQKLKQITKNKKIKIPVSELTHDTLEYPPYIPKSQKFLCHHPQTIKLGWIGQQNGKSVILKNGIFNPKSGKIIELGNYKYDPVIKKYKELSNAYMDELQKTSDLNALRTVTMVLFKEASRSKTKPSQPEDIKAEILALKNDHSTRLSPPILHAEFLGINNIEPDYVELEEICMNKEEQDIILHNIEKNLYPELLPDIPQMWALLEAALTQDEIPIAEISMPEQIEDMLIDYGEKENKPNELLDKILDINQYHHSGHIAITLACGLRDRYLGCQNPSHYIDSKLEEKIDNLNQIITQGIEKKAKNQKTLIQNSKTGHQIDTNLQKFGDPGIDLPF